MSARRRPPWTLMLPALLAGAAVALPLLHLILHTWIKEPEAFGRTLGRAATYELLFNTLLLTAAVLASCTALAWPAAWLTTRTDLPFRRLFTVLLILPLAVPGYLLAYTLLSLGGDYGTSIRLTGVRLPRPTGFLGAWIALTLYNLPYLVLTLRAAILRLDPSLEETAASLGHGHGSRFTRVILPQLWPGYLAGALLIILHVVNDFGVVSLMQYRTLTFALYQRIAAFNLASATAVAVVLMATAGVCLVAELMLLRRLRLERVGAGVERSRASTRLGWRVWPATVFLLSVFAVSVGVPSGTIVYQAWGRAPSGEWSKLAVAAWHSVQVAGPTALLAAGWAVTVALAARRYRGAGTALLERVAMLGYAAPPLAFAFGLMFVSQRVDRALGHDLVYKTLPVLILACTVHFLAEALGPVRASLFRAPAGLEEAARSLGRGRLRVWWSVTLPSIRPGIIVAIALVFLSTMKELPLTLMLRPLDFRSLATELWSKTDEALYREAAPYALTILAISAAFVAVLLLNETGPRAGSGKAKVSL